MDGSTGDLMHLLARIRNDASQISMLGGKELELLSDMDPDSLGDIIQDKLVMHLDVSVKNCSQVLLIHNFVFCREFLGEVKEASSRFLNDRRDAKEALRLLKIYHAATNSMLERGYTSIASTGTSPNETVQ